jgi:hypothetical protein
MEARSDPDSCGVNCGLGERENIVVGVTIQHPSPRSALNAHLLRPKASTVNVLNGKGSVFMFEVGLMLF